MEQEFGAELDKHLSRKSTKKDQLPPEKYPLSDLDNNLVGWDSQDDPANPRNFTDRRKGTILAMVAAITFLSPLASSIFAPGIPFVNADFGNTSLLLGSFAVSVYILGFAVGPLFLSPLSEIYGRCIILNISNVFFCAFTLGCALAPNLGGLIGMRFLAGVGGSACLTIGTGVIADMYVPQQRGRAVAMYSVGILFGPILGKHCLNIPVARETRTNFDSHLCRSHLWRIRCSTCRLALGYVGRFHRRLPLDSSPHRLQYGNLPRRPT